ncbi:MAG: hypothetical protein R6V02_04400 [Candidatus Aminicenantes bacterium]
MIKKCGLKILTLSLMMVVCLSPVWAKDEAVSQWIDVPIQVDGSDEDWAEENLMNFKKYSVDYGFKNNGDYLFSVFIFHDPEYLSSIQQTGMTLWLNPEGKKKKQYGIRFQKLNLTAEQYIQVLESQQGALTDMLKQKIMSEPKHIIHNVFIVNKNEDIIQPSAEFKPALFRSGRHDDRVVYEFAVPLARPAENAFGTGAQPGQSMKVAFEWGGMTEEMKQARLARIAESSTRADASAGGVGDVTAERRVQSRSADMASLRRNAPKQYSFWVDVVLAEKK